MGLITVPNDEPRPRVRAYELKCIAEFPPDKYADGMWTNRTVQRLALDLQEARQQIRELKAFIDGLVNVPKQMQETMRARQLNLDNLDEPMQKLALTFYSKLVDQAMQAKELLEKLSDA